MTAYYNEIEPFCAEWLRNLIVAGHIAPGDVDERDIRDVLPSDLAGYTQCHFFAGLGGWSYALRLAEWPDNRPVWTGSCPCQPFSAAGRRGGFDDERHLWPAWHHLIRECRPAIVFGEQVASPAGYGWLDLVQADLEGASYACGPVVLPAAGVGAPHGRHRLWFVADTRCKCGRSLWPTPGPDQPISIFHNQRCGANDRLADAKFNGRNERTGAERQDGSKTADTRRLDDTPCTRLEGRTFAERELSEKSREIFSSRSNIHVDILEHTTGQQVGLSRRPWIDEGADWIPCRDGKLRPVEPGTFPLAHGAPARVGRLRAYGNAIVPQVAAEFIATYVDIRLTEPSGMTTDIFA
jgi:DNA (cytosine-5)-methyltransferase 1